MEFKNKLKQLRQERGISQQQLASEIFVSRSAIAKWENGLGIPGDVNLEALCIYFGVEEDWLLDRQDLKKCVQIEKRHTAVYVTAALAIISAALIIGLCFVDYFREPIYVSSIWPPTNIAHAINWGADDFPVIIIPMSAWAICLVIPVLTMTVSRLKQHHKACICLNSLCIFIAVLTFLITFCGAVYHYSPVNYRQLCELLHRLFDK